MIAASVMFGTNGTLKELFHADSRQVEIERATHSTCFLCFFNASIQNNYNYPEIYLSQTTSISTIGMLPDYDEDGYDRLK